MKHQLSYCLFKAVENSVVRCSLWINKKPLLFIRILNAPDVCLLKHDVVNVAVDYYLKVLHVENLKENAPSEV